MIATAVSDDAALPCIVRWTGKSGFFSVSVKTYCGQELDASNGVWQWPIGIPLCPACESAVAELKRQLGLR